MKQGIKLFSTFLLLLTTTNQAFALRTNGCGYVRTLVDRKITGALNYKGYTATDTQNYGQSYTQLANSGENTINSLRTLLDSQIRAELSGVSEYDGSSVNVAGPLRFELGGTTRSTVVDASLSLSSISINAKFVKRKRILGIASISARCSVNIHFNQPVFVGEYDINNNLLNFGSSRLNISHGQSCSSSFGWIPFLGNWIEKMMNRKVDAQLEGVIKTIVKERLTQSYAPGNFAGIRQAIPDGKFIIAGNDYGRALREGVIDLFQHNRVSVLMSQRTEGSGFESINNLFEMNFINQGVKFSVTERRKYEMLWQGNGRCLEP